MCVQVSILPQIKLIFLLQWRRNSCWSTGGACVMCGYETNIRTLDFCVVFMLGTIGHAKSTDVHCPLWWNIRKGKPSIFNIFCWIGDYYFVVTPPFSLCCWKYLLIHLCTYQLWVYLDILFTSGFNQKDFSLLWHLLAQMDKELDQGIEVV